MIEYPEVVPAKFIHRNNRFVATCELRHHPDQQVIVHVKNTGRCRELLIPGVDVSLSYQPARSRKTDYDLISVKKEDKWINIDSQVPNKVVEQGIQSKKIILPGLEGEITQLKREVSFKHSRFDFYVETSQKEKMIIEVKGMTLENKGIAAFPDAPTSRGRKHVEEMTELIEEGYQGILLFIVQMDEINITTIDEIMDPKLYKAIEKGMARGLKVLAYTCYVTQNTIELKELVPFQLKQVFVNPNE